MSREGNLHHRENDEAGLKTHRPLRGEIATARGKSRFRLGRLQQQILAYLLENGLRYFKPSMLPLAGSRKEVAEAVARLMRHRLVARVRHGYYAADLERIKQVSLQKRLQFPPVSQAREFPPVSRLVPPGPSPARSRQPARRASSPAAGQQARRAPTQPPAARASGTTPAASKPAPTGTSPTQPAAPTAAMAPSPAQRPSAPTARAPSCSAVCNDRKLSRHVSCDGKIGVVIPGEPVQEILYDNVRALSPAGYVYGDKDRLLRAEDLVRFDRVDYAELTVPTYSDFFEQWGVLKVYYKCTVVNGYGFTCTDFVEWMPPRDFVAKHGIARANYAFRHYVLPAALKVLHRARQVLARRYHHPCIN